MKAILRHLAAHPGGVTLDALIELFGEGHSKQAMLSTLAKLERRDLTARRRETIERRSRLVVFPTTRGQAMGRALPPGL